MDKQVKNVLYHSVFGKVENLDTDEVNTFKVMERLYADITETDEGVRIEIPFDDGRVAVGKSKHNGRTGLKIAYAKALRKVLKWKIEVTEEDAAKTEIHEPDGLTDTVFNTSWVTNFPTGNGFG